MISEKMIIIIIMMIMVKGYCDVECEIDKNDNAGGYNIVIKIMVKMIW